MSLLAEIAVFLFKYNIHSDNAMQYVDTAVASTR